MFSEVGSGKELTAMPLLTAGLGALLGSLPDFIEPAYHPNHRQFFHSWVFATVLVVGFARLWQWTPTDERGKVLRYFGLIAGGAYLVHLAMDAGTPKSLPIVGTL